jgi:nucleoside-diphosphate-sugar epimerase
MKIIVTGGAGFVGSHLVDRLVKDGWGHIVILDNLTRGSLRNIEQHAGNPAVAFVQADIRDYDCIREHFRAADVVFHLAAQSNVMGAVADIDYSFGANTLGTFNVLKAAREGGARRLVFTSSREAYGEARYVPVGEDHPLDCKNAYGASKVAGEVYCRVFNDPDGLRTSVVRMTNVYGPRDKDRVIPLWIGRALRGENLIVYGGQQVIDFVWVDAVVEALLRVSQTSGLDQPTNIGSGQGVSILDLAERVLALAGSSAQLERLPARSAEVTRFVADVSRMRQRLNQQPPADPLFALPQLVEWYRHMA